MEKALEDLHKEKEAAAEEKRQYLEERVPPLDIEGLDKGTNMSIVLTYILCFLYCCSPCSLPSQGDSNGPGNLNNLGSNKEIQPKTHNM